MANIKLHIFVILFHCKGKIEESRNALIANLSKTDPAQLEAALKDFEKMIQDEEVRSKQENLLQLTRTRIVVLKSNAGTSFMFIWILYINLSSIKPYL